MEFQKGDQYVHYTKYGGINRGEVKEIHKTICYDTASKIAYTEYKIINTNNVILSLHGEDGRVYKVIENLDDAAVKRLESLNKFAREMKARPRRVKEDSSSDYMYNWIRERSGRVRTDSDPQKK